MGMIGGVAAGVVGGLIAYKLPKFSWIVPVLVIALFAILGYTMIPW